MAYGSIKTTNYPNGKVRGSRDIRDLTDPDYAELRKPRVVTFYKNGDRYFPGKQLQITPHRYLDFNELMNDLTKKLNLPYGVRKVHTPRKGRVIADTEELQDGNFYVCAGFERYKKMDYDRSRARVKVPTTQLSLPNDSNGSTPRVSPYKNQPSYGRNIHTIHDDRSPLKPKNILLILAGTRPHLKRSMMINKRSVLSIERLIANISEALERPKWRNDRVTRLFSIKGEEIKTKEQLFGDQDVFVGVPADLKLSSKEIHDIIEGLYPESPFQRRIIREHMEAKLARQQLTTKPRELPPVEKKRQSKKATQSDSGVLKTRVSPYTSANRLDQGISSASERDLRPSRIPRTTKKTILNHDRNQYMRSDPRIVRHGRTYTMMEDEEKILKKEIRDRDRRIMEQEKRQEELMHRLRNQEETSKKLKREMKLQSDEQKASRTRAIVEADDQRIRDVQLQYAEKERQMQEQMDKFKRQFEDEQLKLKQKQSLNIQTERERLDRERRRIEQERQEIIEMDLAQRKKDAEQKINDEWSKIENEKKKLDEEKKKVNETSRKTSKESSKRDRKLSENRSEKNTKKLLLSGSEGSLEATIGQGKREDDADHWRKELRAKSRPRTIRQKSDIEQRYEILKKIGDGNFAIVHKCRMKNTQSEFAMKVIDKAIMKGKEEMIENEIAIMRLCRHPNIIKLVEEFETIENIYLILELVRGGDLFDAITESVRYDENTAAGLVADLAGPIAYLHARNIVHRDVKPENCLLERHPNGKLQIKLADFGLAMEVTKPIFQVCGTPTYVAPEILVEGGGNGYGLEVDNWAIGVITYILLCGFPPFRSANRDQNELFDIIVRGEFEFISPYWDNIAEGAMDLIRKLLIINPKKRYTADQILKHSWIKSGGNKGPNLQRQVTMELQRHKLVSQNKKQRNSENA